MKNDLRRLREVMARTGMARSTIYKRINEGLWPKPVVLGTHSVAWPEHEIEAINAARIAGMSDEEIRLLVTQIEILRKSIYVSTDCARALHTAAPPASRTAMGTWACDKGGA